LRGFFVGKKMEIEKYFNSLELKEWKILGNTNGGGQSNTIQVEHISTKEKGVFRVLKKPTEVDIKRFKREIKILTDPKFKHQNIVEIIDYTKSETDYWYISKLGDDFTPHWERLREKYSDNPNQLCSEAINYIIALLEGLKILHEQKVIHRDIKPKNIIIHKEGPQLIDFGLLFVEGEERLSPLNDAVGNVRFSHDTQMNRLDEVPAWLDVFQISQLLIWMLQETPDKSWTRPLHWAYVVYPKLMSQENILKLKAITSICSEPTLSPKNANELLSLLNRLFLSNDKMTISNSSSVNEIKESIAVKSAGRMLELNKDYELLTSSKNTFLSVYEPLYNYLLDFSKTQDFKDLNGHIVSYPISTINQDLDSRPYQELRVLTLMQLYFGDTATGRNFYIYLEVCVLAPSLYEKNYYGFGPDYLPWGFRIHKHANRQEDKIFFLEKCLFKEWDFRLNNKGEIISLKRNEIMTINDIKIKIDKLIFDKLSYSIL
jgi:serine/threonine protein kinase